MTTKVFKESLRKYDQIAKAIWFIQIFYVSSTIFYVPWILKNETVKQVSAKAIFILLLMTLVSVAISLLIRKIYLSKSNIHRVVNSVTSIDRLAMRANGDIDEGILNSLKQLTDEEVKLYSIITYFYRIRYLIVIIPNSSGAIFGLVLANRTGDPLMIIPFMLISLLALGYHFPNFERFIKKQQKNIS